MASLVYKHNSYYAVFSIKRKKKWIKIGKVSRREASRLLKQLELEHLKGKLNLIGIKQILFYDYIEEYLLYSSTNKSSSTYRREKGICNHFKVFFGNIWLSKITNKSIENYKSDRTTRGLEPASINRELAVLMCLLNKALEWEYLEKIPNISILRIPKKPIKFLSLEEMDRLIESSSVWLKPILIVLRNTGMRIGELLNLRFADIDLHSGIILVRSPKTNNYRMVPMNAELKETIEWLHQFYINPRNLNTSPRSCRQMEYLLCLPDGSRVKSIKNSFKNACARAGIDATPHTIRHTFATHLVMNQVDLVSIKELLGHSSISTTMIYSHVSDDHKKKTVAKLPWVREWE